MFSCHPGRKTHLAGLIIVVVLALVAVNPARADKSVIRLLDPAGRGVNVKVSDKTIVAGVASWSPDSRIFVKMINDSQIKPYLEGGEIVFVFAKEIPFDMSMIDDVCYYQEMTEEQCDEVKTGLKAKNGNGDKLYKESFADGLPGKYYFLPEQGDLGVGLFPTVYNPKKGNFEEDKESLYYALVDKFDVPLELMDYVMNKYK